MQKRKYTRTYVNVGTSGYEGGVGTTPMYDVSLGISEHTPRQKGAMCDICGETFREGKVKEFRGKVYGVPCGCSRDIASVIAQEAAKRYTPKRGNEPSGDLIIE